jgi:hypothetical protein
LFLFRPHNRTSRRFVGLLFARVLKALG